MEMARDLMMADPAASWYPKIKDALTVPLHILQDIAKKRREVEAIIDLAVAAAELDIAVETYLDLLQQLVCDQIVVTAMDVTVNPQQTALIPIVNHLSQSLSHGLQKAETLLSASHKRLADAQHLLKTFAEDNRATAEEMQADGVEGMLLAKKFQLAQIEELLVNRVEMIMKNDPAMIFPLEPWPGPDLKRARNTPTEYTPAERTGPDAVSKRMRDEHHQPPKAPKNDVSRLLPRPPPP